MFNINEQRGWEIDVNEQLKTLPGFEKFIYENGHRFSIKGSEESLTLIQLMENVIDSADKFSPNELSKAQKIFEKIEKTDSIKENKNLPFEKINSLIQQKFNLLKSKVSNSIDPCLYAELALCYRDGIGCSGDPVDAEKYQVLTQFYSFLNSEADQGYSFKEKDSVNLLRIFCIFTKAENTAFPENISKYSNKGQKDKLFELAKLCAQQKGGLTANFIKHFGITDQDRLFEVAKLCAQQNGDGTAGYIQNFDITDEGARIEIAKLCAQQNGLGTAFSIKCFNITDEGARIEIAMLCAQQNGEGTAENIENFGITDESARVEIAKLCAQQDGVGTAENIENFGITDEGARIEIAKLCAQQNGEDTARNIENFGITDESARIEIAKLCAQQDGEGTATYIKNFGITDEGARVEIAKLCAQQDGEGTAAYIKNFSITDENTRTEIAKLCAQHDGFGTARYIKNFSITDEGARAEIAKLCAQQNGRGTALYIQNFGITDEGARAEIAKLCVQQNGEGTAKNIQNFGIKDGQNRYRLFNECVKQNEAVYFLISHFSLLQENMVKLSKCIEVLKSNEENKELRNDLFNAVSSLVEELPCSDVNKEIIKRKIEEIENLKPHTQNSAALWLLHSLCFMSDCEQSALDWMLANKMWSELGDLRRPELRGLLTPALFAVAASGDSKNAWDGFISSIGMKKRQSLMLLAISLSGIQLQSVDKKPISDFATTLAQLKIGKDSPLYDVNKSILLLEAAHLLSSSNILTPEQKSRGFSKIFPVMDKVENPEEYQRKIVQNATAAKGLLQLKDSKWADSQSDLGVLFRECFEQLIPLKGFAGDPALKYDEIFANSRNPGALITYAAGLKTLNDPKVLDCLGQYVSSVFSETFKDLRYDTNNNPHLTKIIGRRPDILKIWQEKFEVGLEEISLEGKSKEVFDLKNWVSTKLIIDKHLGETNLFYLSNYLNAKFDEEKKSIFEGLVNDFNVKMKGKKKKEIEQDPDYVNLKLQMECIRLAKGGETTNIKSFENVFKNIKNLLKTSTYATSDFAADVGGILEMLEKSEKKKASQEAFKVLVTDDPIDLLLCGTDVSGSCQRIDGTPDLNKGLLGYLMDGKNQLLVIKDSSGKIVARTMLRLLWDGTDPVLFRERFYPDAISSKESDALNRVAQQIAEKLKVTLTEKGGKGASYGKDLEALGGPAPYEYSDGSGGVQPEGRYSITGLNLVAS